MWRRFQFFEKESVSVPQDIQQSNWVCSTSGRGQSGEPLFLFGNEKGGLQVLDKKLCLRAQFRAHEVQISHLQQTSKFRNLLVSLGQDDPLSPQASTAIKIWDLDQFDLENHSGSPPPHLRSIKLFSSKFPEQQVSSFQATEESPSQLVVAVGFTNGDVYILRGDLVRDKVQQSKVTMGNYSASKALAPGDPSPHSITALHFLQEPRALTLYAVTLSETAAFYLDRPNHPKEVLDSHGAPGECVGLTESGELVLGRTEAVYFYQGGEGRGACFAFEGAKHLLRPFRQYLLVLSSPTIRASASSGGGQSASSSSASFQLTIYDLKNKLIAFSILTTEVHHLLCEFGAVTILQAEKAGFCLREKDTAAKMELLYRKNLYSVAISLIKSKQTGDAKDEGAVAEVLRRYGDHLYSKGDYDGAMAQYLQTIGQLEPSYVIRQYLDARRIDSLTQYLEALHSQGLASADHTTLLLNCYTKQKSLANLQNFIGITGPDEPPEVYSRRFDVETAIKVCRAAGYFEHALQVSRRAGEHEWYLRILLEDMFHYDEALQYLNNLPPAAARQALRKYGKEMVEHKSEGTTELCVRLCTPQPSPTDPSSEDPSSSSSSSGILPPVANPHEFIHVFIERPRSLLRFLDQIATPRLPSTGAPQHGPALESQTLPATVFNTLLELYLRKDLDEEEEEENVRGTGAGGGGGGGRLIEPASRVTREVGAVTAAVSASTASSSAETRVASSTASSRGDWTSYSRRLERAIHLLKAGWQEGCPAVYSVDHALVLCQMHSFKQGALYLYERLGLYQEVLAAHMQAKDHLGVLECCTRLGQNEPELWVEALSYFGSTQSDCSREVREALVHIERASLVPPLVVLQTLARNPRLTLSVVKEYVARCLAQETTQLEADKAAIWDYQEKTAKMRQEVSELQTQARVFQHSKCAGCLGPLDLPATHFLCSHSFHTRCLTEGTLGSSQGSTDGGLQPACSICAPEHRTVLEIKRGLESSHADHDKFFQQLENADDGFSVVADYFGRGIFLPAKPGPEE